MVSVALTARLTFCETISLQNCAENANSAGETLQFGRISEIILVEKQRPLPNRIDGRAQLHGRPAALVREAAGVAEQADGRADENLIE